MQIKANIEVDKNQTFYQVIKKLGCLIELHFIKVVSSPNQSTKGFLNYKCFSIPKSSMGIFFL